MRDDLCSNMWLRLARRRITLPVPVSRNRFPAPLWVFIFGMVAVVSVSLSRRGVYRGRPTHAAVTDPGAGPFGRATGYQSSRCCYRLGRTRDRGAVGGGLARRRLRPRWREPAGLSGWRRGAALSGLPPTAALRALGPEGRGVVAPCWGSTARGPVP